MHQLQTLDTSGSRFALAQIASYRMLQEEHRQALEELDQGIRHLDPGPNGWVDATERYRQRHLDAIAELERWVRVWERDLMDVG